MNTYLAFSQISPPPSLPPSLLTIKGITAVTRFALALCMVETSNNSSIIRSLTGWLQLWKIYTSRPRTESRT